jgi:hypothetical protein
MKIIEILTENFLFIVFTAPHKSDMIRYGYKVFRQFLSLFN